MESNFYKIILKFIIDGADNKSNILRIFQDSILSGFFYFSLYCLDCAHLMTLVFFNHPKVLHPISPRKMQINIS